MEYWIYHLPKEMDTFVFVVHANHHNANIALLYKYKKRRKYSFKNNYNYY